MPKWGWIPDIPDARDYVYEAPLKLRSARALPSNVDLRKNCPPVFNQGALGSCTANALLAAVEFGKKIKGQKTCRLSRLFLYYNERMMMCQVVEQTRRMSRKRVAIQRKYKTGCKVYKEASQEMLRFGTRPSDLILLAHLSRHARHTRLPCRRLSVCVRLLRICQLHDGRSAQYRYHAHAATGRAAAWRPCGDGSRLR